jgi:DHA1 family bicyclomycin/chloramphenicol resistance-like MFS transporter
VSGAFLSYLNTSQQIFQVQYGLGRLFPLYFSILAFSVGLASLLNGRLVMRLGMHALANRALFLMTVLAWLFLAMAWWFDGHPPLWLFILICFVLFFCIGILFGNLNSIAMEPLGHVAGTAAAVIGSTTTLLAAGLGFLIGRAYDGSLLPVALGFVGLTTISLLMTTRLENK